MTEPKAEEVKEGKVKGKREREREMLYVEEENNKGKKRDLKM